MADLYGAAQPGEVGEQIQRFKTLKGLIAREEIVEPDKELLKGHFLEKFGIAKAHFLKLTPPNRTAEACRKIVGDYLMGWYSGLSEAEKVTCNNVDLSVDDKKITDYHVSRIRVRFDSSNTRFIVEVDDPLG